MTAPNGQAHAQLDGRYWPTKPVQVDPPRLPDGSVDIRALCRLYDDLINRGTP